MIERAVKRIVWPVSVDCPGRRPAMVWSTPKLLMILKRDEISASLGTLPSSSVSSVSRLAIMRGKAAFLAPEIGIFPLSGAPPRMRMRSIGLPLGPSPRPLIVGALVRAWLLSCLAPIRGRGCLTAPRLNLAPFQVFPERRFQSVGPGLRFGIGHDSRDPSSPR